MGRRTWPSVVLGLSALAAWPAGAAADADPVGPPIGNNSYQGAISTPADTDDFTGEFLTGEILTLSVVSAKAGKDPPTLRPSLVLIDPHGIVRTAGATIPPAGTSVTYKSVYVDQPGLWTARVAGRDGTSGPYTVKFGVRALRKQTRRGEVLGGGRPLTNAYEFAGLDGASFSAAATWGKGYTPVEFTAILRPDGSPVRMPDGSEAVSRVSTKGRKTQVSRILLDGGPGLYQLVTRIASGQAVFTLTTDVRPPKRPASAKPARITDTEPELDALDVPKAGEAGDTVRFTGRGFATGKARPVVRFGTAVSPGVTVSADGTAIDCVVPPRAGSAFVALYVVNPDGQGAARDGLFAYQPAPVVQDLVDDTSGAQVRSSSTAGGRRVRLTGEHFEEGYVVRVGGAAAAGVTRVSETELRFSLPAGAAGLHRVTVTDPFRREAASDFDLLYKTPPAFAASPYSPGAVRVNAGTTLTIRGTGFLDSDQVRFGGSVVPSSYVDGTTRTVPLSPMPAGAYAVEFVDSIGTVVAGPPLYVKGPGVVSAVLVQSGPVIDGNVIPLAGGPVIRVDGSSFAPTDIVSLGGLPISSLTTNTTTRKVFAAPGGLQGPVQLLITDGAGQTTTVDDVLRYAGFGDDTSTRHPVPDGSDDFRATRGAVGDLDGDGSADDVVIVSPMNASIGTRAERTRVLFGDRDGALVDETADSIPAARSDPAGLDTWDAQCLALGDIDRDGSADIVLGGRVTFAPGYPQVRVLLNDGGGGFSHTVYGPESRYDASTQAYYATAYYGYRPTPNPLFGAQRQQGLPTALAIGDLDGDGDAEIVAGTDHFQSRDVYYDPSKARYTYVGGYYGGRFMWIVNRADTASYRQYVPALRIYDNQFGGEGGRMADVSTDRLGSAGTSLDPTGQPPALHAKDVVLGDVDRDGDLDMIVAWDDPTTVTAYGLSGFETNGQSATSPEIATRVLLNDGGGGFRDDATTTWMPTPSRPEYWQADRAALADLDEDGDLDLVLVISASLDSWTGTPTRARRALRVLQNAGDHFTDQTSGLPVLAGNDQDDYRGDALSVRDVDGDGHLDIVVGTRQALVTTAGARVASTRVFFGTGGMTFTLGRAFAESAATDSGEASDLLWSDDLDAGGAPVLLLLDDQAPVVSPTGRKLRTETWRK